jgi:hypothetical protein
MIEDIKSLRPEFEGHALFDREMFKQRHVDVPVTGIAQEISARIAQG